MRAVAAALAFAAGVTAGAGGGARADGLAGWEADRLLHGQTVVRDESWESSGRRYVGGIAYALLDVSADEIAALAASAEGWRRILPKVRSARWVGTVGGDALIELTQGTALVHATYTLRVRRDHDEIRFWMDRRRPHDVEDAWGFLRARPRRGGRTLVTYGVLIDMGPGILRDLFETRVRDAALSVLDRLRGVVEGRDASNLRAAR